MSMLPSQKICIVPGCTNINCKLRTHQKYYSNRTERLQAGVQRRASLDTASKQIELYKGEIPPEKGVDGLPRLPLEDGLDPDIRALFHYFFTTSFEKLALLFRGPSMTNMALFKERMLRTALSSESYCCSLVLQARTEQDLASKNYEETKESLDLMNKTLKAFREQLNLIHEKPDALQIELALLVLCVLMMYDVAHGRNDSQRVHWNGMKDLVALRGGIHSVTTALAYVIHADRACAVRYESPPTYTSHTKALSLPSPIPDPGSMKPKSKFSGLKESKLAVDPLVIDYLIDVSGLVGLWEDFMNPKSAEPKRRVSTGASSGYLTFMRDQVDERFAVLNAQWAPTATSEKILLLACRIIEFPCTWSNYDQSMARHLHGRLATTLQEQHQKNDLLETWHSNLDILMWVLFALSTFESDSEVCLWAIRLMQKTLDVKYGSGVWPVIWPASEQENLFDLVWSDALSTGQFQRVCSDLESTSRGGAEVRRVLLG